MGSDLKRNALVISREGDANTVSTGKPETARTVVNCGRGCDHVDKFCFVRWSHDHHIW
jgi:DNA repair photolyase